MNGSESAEIVPLPDSEGTEKIPLKKICVKVYLSELEFLLWVKLAEEAGIRARGLKPFRLKPHGFSHQRVVNTKGLVKFLKKRVVPYWIDGEKERKDNEAKLKAEAEKKGFRLVRE